MSSCRQVELTTCPPTSTGGSWSTSKPYFSPRARSTSGWPPRRRPRTSRRRCGVRGTCWYGYAGLPASCFLRRTPYAGARQDSSTIRRGLKGGTFASDISLQTTSLCRDAGIIIICHGAQAHPMRAGNESAILLTKYEELLWHKLLQEKLPHELPQHKDSYRQD